MRRLGHKYRWLLSHQRRQSTATISPSKFITHNYRARRTFQTSPLCLVLKCTNPSSLVGRLLYTCTNPSSLVTCRHVRTSDFHPCEAMGVDTATVLAARFLTDNSCELVFFPTGVSTSMLVGFRPFSKMNRASFRVALVGMYGMWSTNNQYS